MVPKKLTRHIAIGVLQMDEKYLWRLTNKSSDLKDKITLYVIACTAEDACKKVYEQERYRDYNTTVALKYMGVVYE